MEMIEEEEISETEFSHVGMLGMDRFNKESAKDVIARYRILRERWLDPEDTLISDQERNQRLFSNFKVDTDDLQISELNSNYQQCKYELDFCLCHANRFASFMGEGVESIQQDLQKMLYICRATHNALQSQYSMKLYSTAQPAALADNTFLKGDVSEDTDNQKQQVLAVLYHDLACAGSRKLGSYIYEPIYTQNFYITQAYRQDITIRQFVTQRFRRYSHKDNWNYLMRGRRSSTAMYNEIVEILRDFEDADFPLLEVDRHKFSFPNGIFMTRVKDTDPNSDDRFTCRFYPYDSPTIKEVSDRYASANYFEQEFTEFPMDMDWYDISTPTIQYLLEYQFGNREDCEEICRFAYIMLGRMLYDRGDLDNWQIMTWWIGQAGTGKSTLLEFVLSRIYQTCHIVNFDNEMQDVFGLGDALTKHPQYFMMLASDIDEHFRISQSQLIRMISGEQVTANVKSAGAIETRTTSHIMAAANVMPPFREKAGQLMRRFLIFIFLRIVLEADKKTDLHERIQENLPNIIQKLVRAYLWAANKYPGASLRKFAPKYFTETSEDLTNETNHLFSFITDTSRILISPELLVPETEFFNEYRDYCKERNLRCPHISSKNIVYQGLVQQLNAIQGCHVTYDEDTRDYQGTHFQRQMFFFGIGLVSHVSTEEEFRIRRDQTPQNPAISGDFLPEPDSVPRHFHYSEEESELEEDVI
jgi:hypothetical protein